MPLHTLLCVIQSLTYFVHYSILKNADAQKSKPRRRRKSPSAPSQMTDNTVKRNTRSSSNAKLADGGVITIDSSSDEEDDTSVDASNDTQNNTSNDISKVRFLLLKVQQRCHLYQTDRRHHLLLQQAVADRRASLRPKRAVGDLASIDAVRIAIGKKIFKSKCELSFQFGTSEPYIQFAFEDRGNMSENRVYLKSGEELKEVKYRIADDNDAPEGDDISSSMTVIAFRITPTDKNNLIKFTSSYDREESDQITGKQYISVEVRDADDFRVRIHGVYVRIRVKKCQL